MFDNLFDNIGDKIKGLAKVLFLLAAIVLVIGGLAHAEGSTGLSLLCAIVGILVAWISAWFLYGFGEIIDKLYEIERNTRDIERNTRGDEKKL